MIIIIIILSLKHSDEVNFYNACSSRAFAMSTEELVGIGLDMLVEKELFTIGPQVWYPITTITDNKHKFYVQYIFFQLLPALVLDSIIKLTKGKPL